MEALATAQDAPASVDAAVPADVKSHTFEQGNTDANTSHVEPSESNDHAIEAQGDGAVMHAQPPAAPASSPLGDSLMDVLHPVLGSLTARLVELQQAQVRLYS